MNGYAVRNRAVRRARNHTRSVEHRFETLLRQLLDCIDDVPLPRASSNRDRAAEEILLQVQLDGALYILVRSPDADPSHEIRLSPREKEIVRLVSEGHPNKTIAAILEISPWTVATHVRRVFVKFKVNSRAEMIVRAMETGQLEPRQPEAAKLRPKPKSKGVVQVEEDDFRA